MASISVAGNPQTSIDKMSEVESEVHFWKLLNRVQCWTLTWAQSSLLRATRKFGSSVGSREKRSFKATLQASLGKKSLFNDYFLTWLFFGGNLLRTVQSPLKNKKPAELGIFNESQRIILYFLAILTKPV